MAQEKSEEMNGTISNCPDVSRDFLRLAGVRAVGPSYEYLARLAQDFSRFPYENFTKILRAAEFKDPARRLRTPEIVLGDHIDMGAGGTCFSLTNFFRGVLEHQGFELYPVLCDRSYGPDTHCAIVVCMGARKYLVDPGYLMREPMPVPDRGESVQRGPHGLLRLVRLGGSRQLVLFSESGGARKLRYRLKDVPVPDDLFVRRWTQSFGWAMMRHLCASRQTEEGQVYMRDGSMRRVCVGRRGQVRIDSNFAMEIERNFGIDRRLVELAREFLAARRNKAGSREKKSPFFR